MKKKKIKLIQIIKKTLLNPPLAILININLNKIFSPAKATLKMDKKMKKMMNMKMKVNIEKLNQKSTFFLLNSINNL
jgi:hypothetical protein